MGVSSNCASSSLPAPWSQSPRLNFLDVKEGRPDARFSLQFSFDRYEGTHGCTRVRLDHILWLTVSSAHPLYVSFAGFAKRESVARVCSNSELSQVLVLVFEYMGFSNRALFFHVVYACTTSCWLASLAFSLVALSHTNHSTILGWDRSIRWWGWVENLAGRWKTVHSLVCRNACRF